MTIEQVSPEVDAGRYPAKRTLGDAVEVSADAFKDGHDLVAARVRWRRPGERAWQTAPMEFDYDEDRWFGSFAVDQVGRWSFTVEAWPDAFGTWRSELVKKVEAEQDVALELREGAEILAAAGRRSKGPERARLGAAAERLANEEIAAEDRIALGLGEDLVPLARAAVDPATITQYARELEIVVDPEIAGFAAWYELFPRSQAREPGKHGTFADAERRLGDLAALGFDVVYLPPIHPIGRSYRKGKNNALEPTPDDVGSPWAIGSEEGGHTAVHPALGTIEDFGRFVRAANERGLQIALDYALQCSPDHPWVKEHPDWFFIRPDGSIRYAENPPKKYQDIVPINFWCDDWTALWEACKEIFLFWIARGVRIFRVDNPHTKPLAFWEWVIAEVKREHPDVIFFAEAFTRPKRMKALAKLGFSQSYTYFTWRNIAEELREYGEELTQTEVAEYFRPNFFANTPDILHEFLQKGGRPAFRIRLLLAATLSPLYGIYSGFELCENEPLKPKSEEYLNSEKYELRPRDYNAPGNLNAEIARLNAIRRENVALQRLTNLEFLECENERMLFYWKSAPGNELLIAVTLNPEVPEATMVEVPLEDLGIDADEPFEVEDLLTGAVYTWSGSRNYVRLDPSAGEAGHIFKVRSRGQTSHQPPGFPTDG